jgi:Putative DNA-binding domain
MSARAIYDEIIAGNWDGVQAWLANEQEESLFLDFKRRRPGAPQKLELADKTVLSTALSGFANVEGGVVVLGVDARKAPNGHDKVIAIDPIDNVASFADVLIPELKKLTDPSIPGLDVRTIREPGHECGVVVIYVPQSDGRPHRAAGADKETNDRYFMRTAKCTVNMPHSILAAMFGRRPQPKLRLLVQVLRPEGNTEVQLVCWLRNDGRGPAMNPRLLLHLRGGELTFDVATFCGETTRECHADRYIHGAPILAKLVHSSL